MNKFITIIFLFLLFSIFIFAISLEECDGCIIGDKCLSFEVRRAGLFCDINGSIGQQKVFESVCLADYQCQSNSCSAGACNELSFLNKLSEGFKDIYVTLTNSDDGVSIILYEPTSNEALSTNFSLNGCTGCFNDEGRCVGISYSSGGKFCDKDHIFKKQWKGGESCSADFQCKSKECMRDNTCHSTGVFRSLFMWMSGNS